MDGSFVVTWAPFVGVGGSGRCSGHYRSGTPSSFRSLSAVVCSRIPGIPRWKLVAVDRSLLMTGSQPAAVGQQQPRLAGVGKFDTPFPACRQSGEGGRGRLIIDSLPAGLERANARAGACYFFFSGSGGAGLALARASAFSRLFRAATCFLFRSLDFGDLSPMRHPIWLVN